MIQRKWKTINIRLSARCLERMKLIVKKIMRDPLFLAQKSVDAMEADKQVVATWKVFRLDSTDYPA